MNRLAALWKKDPGVVVSGGAHGLALVLLLANFSHAPPLEDAHETTPIEMVTTSELNQIMNGEPTAKPLPQAQRRVDKVAALEEFKPDPPTLEAKKDTPPPPAPGKANDDPGQDEKPPEKAAAVPPPPPPPRPADPAPPVPAAAMPPVPTPPERPVEKAEAPPQPADAPTPPPRPEPVKPPPPPEAEAVEPTPPPRPKIEPRPDVKPDPKPEPPKKVAKLPPVKPVPRPVVVKEAKVVPLPPREPPKDVPKEAPKKPEPTTLDRVAQLLDTLKPDVLKPDASKPPKPPVRQRAGNEAKEPAHDDFSLAKISALLDHEAPQHKASTGRALAQVASLGAPNAHAEKMSPQLQAQIDNWFIDHYIGCWHYFGTGADLGYIPKVRVIVTADGALVGRPQLINPPSNPNLHSLADSAMRAVKECDPLPIPAWIRPHYEMWQNHVIDFDPKEKA